MAANRYGNFLTVLLVIVIILVIVGLGFLIYNVVKSDDSSDEAIANFDSNLGETQGNENTADTNVIDIGKSNTVDNTSSGGSGGGSAGIKKQYYEGFVMIGHIEISKTGIKYPILENGSDRALEKAVGIMYPNDAILKLNAPGNVVIMGHNFRNGKFFSNNKKLETGDKIKITGYSGSLTYTIYEIFETTPGDTAFITRDTKGATEISLSTCTDDGARRLIILAKAN
jgi:LPXTG-site transpeptidase (sortase) family protein